MLRQLDDVILMCDLPEQNLRRNRWPVKRREDADVRGWQARKKESK
jgi:hypothetical protein